ncbi:MAG: Gfo/Idh/MocA family oxidoreductase [Armatimonadota bacterium]|nr:Gfo/Idh/MocA family oxidoreductase [Armatimonadota bacterium]
MGDLKAAIIGCGHRAKGHAAGFADAEGVSCAACADIDRERADAFGEELGLRPYYEAMEMLEVESPDIVAIVTREGTRARLTRMCAEKRIPGVIAEKPMARTLDEARDMVRVCDENGTVLTVCQQMTFSREYELLKACIDAGEIGEVRFLRACSYGQLMEQGPHMVDMLLWLRQGHGVTRVMGQAAGTAGANETVHPAPLFSCGYLVFDDDVRCVLETGRSFQPYPEMDSTWMQKRVMVIGTEGAAEAVVGHYFRKMTPALPGWDLIETGVESWNSATARFIEELVEVLSQGGEHRNGAERSLAGFEVIQAIFQSVMERDAVEPPLPAGATPLEDLLDAFGVEPQVQ